MAVQSEKQQNRVEREIGEVHAVRLNLPSIRREKEEVEKRSNQELSILKVAHGITVVCGVYVGYIRELTIVKVAPAKAP